MKRFHTAGLDISNIPLEVSLNSKSSAKATSEATYGPGENYGTYGDLVVKNGQAVTIISIENEYAQVEWEHEKELYRAWVPLNTLRY